MTLLRTFRWSESLVAIALGTILLFAAYPKLIAPREFACTVYHFRLIGPSARIPLVLPNAFAVAVPWIEALTGALLVVGVWRRDAAVVCAVVSIAFLVAVGWASSNGIEIDNSGCFSVHGRERRAGIGLLVGDVAMLIGAVWLIAACSRSEKAAVNP